MKEILDFRTIFQYGEWFKIKIENVRSNVHKNPYPFILHKWFVIPIPKATPLWSKPRIYEFANLFIESPTR